MTKIQIELDEEENQIVELQKILHKFKTKEETIKKIIRFFKSDIVFEKAELNNHVSGAV